MRNRTAMRQRRRARRVPGLPTARRAPAEASRGRTLSKMMRRSRRRPRQTAATQSRSGLRSRPAARRRVGRRRATTTTTTTCPCCRRGGARRSARASSARTWTRYRGRCGAPAAQAARHGLQPPLIPAARTPCPLAGPPCLPVARTRPSDARRTPTVQLERFLPFLLEAGVGVCPVVAEAAPHLACAPSPRADGRERTARARARAQNLDFDFEKCCSVSLSPVNVYACLVCGKYFQARAIGLGYIAAQGSLRRFPALPLPRFRCALSAASCWRPAPPAYTGAAPFDPGHLREQRLAYVGRRC